jgi:hypothetical protein
VAKRVEEELGEERKPRDFTTLEAIAELPLPDGPMTVGIDGGYVRAAHKQGCFEVIAGSSVVAFRRRKKILYRRRNALASCRLTIRSRGSGFGR